MKFVMTFASRSTSLVRLAAAVLPFAAPALLASTAQAQTEAAAQKSQIRELNKAAGTTLKKAVENKESAAPPAVRTKLRDVRAELLKPQTQTLIGGKPTFVVGDSNALRRPIDRLAGARPPADLASRVAQQVVETQKWQKREAALNGALAEKGLVKVAKPLVATESAASPVCDPKAKRFDWRDHGAVRAVKDQGQCGSCWAFAAVAAIEGSYFVRNRDSYVGSEQQVLDCSKAGSCADGGWYSEAWGNLQGEGNATGNAYPYTAADNKCRWSTPTPYHWNYWGWVNPNQNPQNYAEPTPRAMIKDALCERGPLATTVTVTDAFAAYSTGVFNEKSDKPINHAVTIVGWDDADDAWIIKNSWGAGWGENGYMRIHHDANRIGVLTAWVVARKPVQLVDDCSRFEPSRVRLRNVSGQWRFVYNGRNIYRLGERQEDAEQALAAMKFYKVDRRCSVGGVVNEQSGDIPVRAFEYYLAGAKTPTGAMPGETCEAFDTGRIDVNKQGQKWILEDGVKTVASFDKEDDAWLSYAYLRRHGFTHRCRIGSFFNYYRR